MVTARTPTPLPEGCVALVVGVVADVSLDSGEEALLRQRFGAFLDLLKKTYPNTPIVALSTIATKADRIALHEAHVRGHATVVALPSDPTTITAELTEPADLELFQTVAEGSHQLEFGKTRSDDDLLAAEAFVVTYSDYVVSLERTRGDESTANKAAIHARLTGVLKPDLIRFWKGQAEGGPVYRIILSESEGEEAEDFIDLGPLFAPARGERDSLRGAFDDAVRRIDTFNRDLALANSASVGGDIAGLRKAIAKVVERLQNITMRYLYALYALAFLATAAQYSPFPIVRYPAILIAFIFLLVARRKDYEDRYQDYRGISEGMRVQAAWLAANIDDRRVDQCYLAAQQRDLLWIRMALRWMHFRYAEFGSPSPGKLKSGPCHEWRTSQIRYFAKDAREAIEGKRNVARASRVLLAVVATVSTLLFLYLYSTSALLAAGASLGHSTSGIGPLSPAALRGIGEGFVHTGEAVNASWLVQNPIVQGMRSWERSGCTILNDPGVLRAGSPCPHKHQFLVSLSTEVLALYAAVALLLGHFADKRGFSVNAVRSKRMLDVFSIAHRQIEALPEGSQTATDLVRKLGREALVENGQWLISRRQRPLKLEL
jgi:hypothetical protein